MSNVTGARRTAVRLAAPPSRSKTSMRLWPNSRGTTRVHGPLAARVFWKVTPSPRPAMMVIEVYRSTVPLRVAFSACVGGRGSSAMAVGLDDEDEPGEVDVNVHVTVSPAATTASLMPTSLETTLTE